MVEFVLEVAHCSDCTDIKRSVHSSFPNVLRAQFGGAMEESSEANKALDTNAHSRFIIGSVSEDNSEDETSSLGAASGNTESQTASLGQEGGHWSVLDRAVVLRLLGMFSQLALAQLMQNLKANLQRVTFPEPATCNGLAAQKGTTDSSCGILHPFLDSISAGSFPLPSPEIGCKGRAKTGADLREAAAA
ncbi:hypothetical protein IHE44_0007359 [Lamprotornis superbus]|uniref:Uncharacterized protein n=1 Tax=Lamprotornis superbus TaxID=245042 RepID=A0A835TY30_9PASS|nr:hypothetical protein IHE44_0007359 [Lamprotornis superbus]